MFTYQAVCNIHTSLFYFLPFYYIVYFYYCLFVILLSIGCNICRDKEMFTFAGQIKEF